MAKRTLCQSVFLSHIDFLTIYALVPQSKGKPVHRAGPDCPATAFEPCGLLTAAGRGLFVPGCNGEQVRGDGQGFGAGGASVNTPHRAVAVSWQGESRYRCCGCRARCCCDSPPGSCAHGCSSCRRGSRGCRLFLPLAFFCPWSVVSCLLSVRQMHRLLIFLFFSATDN